MQADGLIDDITDFDSVTNLDFFGDVVSVGSYIFQNTLDLGAKYDVELLANLKINTINPDFWDSRSDNIDTWNDIDADDLSRPMLSCIQGLPMTIQRRFAHLWHLGAVC